MENSIGNFSIFCPLLRGLMENLSIHRVFGRKIFHLTTKLDLKTVYGDIEEWLIAKCGKLKFGMRA